MRLVIFDDNGKRVLSVTSDGEANYKVRGTHLRDNVKSYKTSDDMHVVGLIHWLWGSYASREYLRRRLNERDRNNDV